MFSNGVRKETRALANVASRVGYSASRPVAELVSHSSLEQVHSSLGVIETQSNEYGCGPQIHKCTM